MNVERAQVGRWRPWWSLLAILVGIVLITPAVYFASVLHSFPAVLRHRTEPPRQWAMLEIRAREARQNDREWSPRFTWVPLSDISPDIVQAVLAGEDEIFYQHDGFDYDALWLAWNSGDTRGTSTITQQTVKNLYLSPVRTFSRKLREAVLTWWMEHFLSKDRILELYLNIVELGPGIFGVEAASRFYFNRSADLISREQAALLAATLPAPLSSQPASPSPSLLRRQRSILFKMQRYYERMPPLPIE